LEKTKKPDSTKIAILLSAIGLEALGQHKLFKLYAGEDKNKFTHVKAKFTNELVGQKWILFSR